jgi:hypothetical protein
MGLRTGELKDRSEDSNGLVQLVTTEVEISKGKKREVKKKERSKKKKREK